MGSIASLSDLANRLTGGNSGNPQHLWFWMDNRIQAAAGPATVAARMSSLWRTNKTNGANGAVPTTVVAPTRATLGALGQANPSGGQQLYLLGLDLMATQIGSLILYDRLLQIGGLSGTNTSAQTVGGSLTRYNANATCVGNQIWVEINTAIGGTATTITASYTNQAGVSGQTTKAVAIGGGGLQEQTRLISLPLADGDSGVQAVASVTLAATTGTAGDFGVVVARPLLAVGTPGASVAQARDTLSGMPSLPEILTDACLAFAYLAGTTTLTQAMVGVHMVEA